MLKKFTVFIISALIMTAFFSSNTYATNARVESLGGNSLFFLDETDIFNNPANIVKYPNFAIIELQDTVKNGNSEPLNTEAGATFKVNEDIVLGLYLNRLDNNASAINYDSDKANVSNPVDLFASFRLRGLPLGVHLYRATGISYSDDFDYNKKSSVTGFDLGTLLDLGNKSILDIAVGYNNFSAKNEVISTGTYSLTKSDGDYNFRGRILMEQKDDIKLIPVFGYSSMKTKGVDDTDDKTENYQLLLGVGVNKETKNNMLYSGITYYNMNSSFTTELSGKTKYKRPSTIIFNAGVESNMFDKEWIKGRIGIDKIIFGTIESKNNTGDKFKSDITTNDTDFITLGLGFNFNNFVLDAVVYENNLYSGTYLLSGEKSNLISKISMAYKF